MGLIVSIYQDKTYSGSSGASNGGVSSKVNELTLVNVDGPFEPTMERPAAELLPGNLDDTVKVVPLETLTERLEVVPARPEGSVGPMFGGCYVGTSDGRFEEAIERITGARFYGAVQLHDRFETRAQYDALSQ